MGVPEYHLSAKFLPKYQLSVKNLTKYQLSVKIRDYQLTLEGLRGPPLIFMALNFCSLTDYQKLCYNCSLFVNTCFDSN